MKARPSVRVCVNGKCLMELRMIMPPAGFLDRGKLDVATSFPVSRINTVMNTKLCMFMPITNWCCEGIHADASKNTGRTIHFKCQE